MLKIVYGGSVHSNPSRRMMGVTLVEVLVVLFIMGLLLATLLPAVQYARESMRKAHCKSKLRQIGIALQNYHAAFGVLPPGAVTRSVPRPADPYGIAGSTNQDSFAPWTVLTLPYVEQQALHDQFSFEEPFFGFFHPPIPTPNDAAQLTRVPLWECPSDPNSRPNNANCNYFGVQGGGEKPAATGANFFQGRVFFFNGVFYHNSSTSIADILDGSSNVFAVGETRYMQLIGGGVNQVGTFYGTWASSHWIAGSSQRDLSSVPVTIAAALDPINSIDRDPAQDWVVEHQSRLFGSHHAEGCHFLFADGSTKFVNQSIELSIYRSLAARNDRQP